jgi:hypothetical protein
MHTGTLLTAAFQSQGHEQRYRDALAVQVAVFGTARSPPLFSGHYLRNRSTLDIRVLGYIGVL